MDVQWNDDAGSVMAAMVARVQAVLVDVSRDYSGKPVDEVKTVLQEQWASANEGASITDPELTGAATAISDGKRVWMEDNGTIMAED
ncbi:hypothetical protein ACSBOX_21315 (plasmid) [Arthrobacter sp. KN11-1C]|uniref:hypothetical protein n=1 Tax=Arthrobacter sp. KN11-1C TaxID=3445774 RepID=UPI003FA0451E